MVPFLFFNHNAIKPEIKNINLSKINKHHCPEKFLNTNLQLPGQRGKYRLYLKIIWKIVKMKISCNETYGMLLNFTQRQDSQP